MLLQDSLQVKVSFREGKTSEMDLVQENCVVGIAVEMVDGTIGGSLRYSTPVNTLGTLSNNHFSFAIDDQVDAHVIIVVRATFRFPRCT